MLTVTLLSFAMMRMAGSDVIELKMENTGYAASEETIEAARDQLGLDRPFLQQYGSWLWRLLHGDMGTSYVSGKDVFELFCSKLPATLLLTVVSIALTLLVSIPLGILTAVYQNRWIDVLVRALSFLGNAMPNFFVALLLMDLFAIRLGWLPVLASGTGLRGVIMPALTLAIAMSAKYVRQVRAAVLGELHQGYVIGAMARGVRFSVILCGSVLKCSMTMLLTLLTLSIGNLLGGTAIVENIFQWDGVGKMAVDAINMRDYPIVQAYVMWMAILYMLINLVTDLSYRLIDPRIRLGGMEE